jgi:AcrR family transcriptional regulator
MTQPDQGSERGSGPLHFPVSPTLRQPAKELGPRAARTIARILAATKQIFLTRGYAGTTIDEITKVADVSRASFYTYFPSKRDALLALGADAASATLDVLRHARELEASWDDHDIENLVREYFAHLDQQGSFAFAWTQAAHEDEEIRVAGMKRHLELCRNLGVVVGDLRGEPFDDPTTMGLALFAMFERSWSYCGLYEGTLEVEAMQRTIAETLSTLLRPPEPRELA